MRDGTTEPVSLRVRFCFLCHSNFESLISNVDSNVHNVEVALVEDAFVLGEALVLHDLDIVRLDNLAGDTRDHKVTAIEVLHRHLRDRKRKKKKKV